VEYLKYKLDGRIVKEQQKPEGSRFGKFAQPLFLDNDHFIIANNRPILPTDNEMDSFSVLQKKKIFFLQSLSMTIKFN
jgi:hypothetical protein